MYFILYGIIPGTGKRYFYETWIRCLYFYVKHEMGNLFPVKRDLSASCESESAIYFFVTCEMGNLFPVNSDLSASGETWFLTLFIPEMRKEFCFSVIHIFYCVCTDRAGGGALIYNLVHNVGFRRGHLTFLTNISISYDETLTKQLTNTTVAKCPVHFQGLWDSNNTISMRACPRPP